MCQNIKKHTCEAMLFFRTAVTHKSHRFYYSDNATEPDQKKKQSSPLSAFSSARVDGPGSGVCGPGAGISPSTSNSVSFSKFSLQYNRRLC